MDRQLVVRLLPVVLIVTAASAVQADPAPIDFTHPHGKHSIELAFPAPLDEPTRELVVERYPSGAVRIQREMILDDAENYLNDGSWALYNERGNVMGKGNYIQGQRDAQWMRQFASVRELNFALPPLAQQFQAPLVSQARFVNGALDGDWTIKDAAGRPIISWSFKNGLREGVSTTFHPNGAKWREATYHQGLRDGAASEWSANKHLVRSEQFAAGRLVTEHVEWYGRGLKKLQVTYLSRVPEAGMIDDWWTATSQEPAIHPSDRQAHGVWISWYPNQQKASEGRYEDGQQADRFVWWHDNGQKACEGHYADGKPSGRWIWWHANGQKQMQGEYTGGVEIGTWIAWDEEGQIIRREDMAGAAVAKSAESPSRHPEIGRLPPVEEARPIVPNHETARRDPGRFR